MNEDDTSDGTATTSISGNFTVNARVEPPGDAGYSPWRSGMVEEWEVRRKIASLTILAHSRCHRTLNQFGNITDSCGLILDHGQRSKCF